MTATLRRTAFLFGAALLALIASPLRAQELAGPPGDLVIAWRSPQSATMPTVTWTIRAGADQVASVRTEARALFERMTTEGTAYRALFPLRHVDPFGSIYEFEFDRAAVDAIGRLDEGKAVRIPVKSVATITSPQTKQQMRNEYPGATVLTVEKHESIEVPAGRFDTIVIRLEGDTSDSRLPPNHRTYRRYWYAPALGWYVRHEVVIIGPTINQRNEYHAVKITRSEKSAERK
jgi:hypothetical protein